MKLVRIVAIVLGTYAVLGLSFDAAIGFFQPHPENTAVLRTFDKGGQPKDTVLSLLDDNGQLWVESGHWFRGWYKRVLANPDVELIRGGQAAPYRAVPVDTPADVEHVQTLMGNGKRARYWIARTMLLWAPIKPVRLDPRPPQ
ncbi:MAG TPA: nitroreductase/quinone reductase family protein [Myxococcota bacterium]|nr:nitroreductase/quinone reductase family protein [Myxococcota bacterium]